MPMGNSAKSCAQLKAEPTYLLKLITIVHYVLSELPELCALARILFYVTSVRIRVFMRTLESKLVL